MEEIYICNSDFFLFSHGSRTKLLQIYAASLGGPLAWAFCGSSQHLQTFYTRLASPANLPRRLNFRQQNNVYKETNCGLLSAANKDHWRVKP